MSDEGYPRAVGDAVELTGESLLKKMREIVKPPGKKGVWLQEANDRQLAEVYHRLRLKQPAYRIAKLCKEEWHLGDKNSSPKSMSRVIRMFRDKMFSDVQLELMAAKNDNVRKEQARELSKKAKKIDRSFDALGRLGWVIQRQTERLEILLEREKNALPFKFTDRTIEVLTKQLETYIKLQMELGVLDSKPSEVNLNVKHRFDGLMSNTVSGGSGVVDAANRFLELAEKKALTLKLDKDGRYALDKPEEDDDVPDAESNSG